MVKPMAEPKRKESDHPRSAGQVRETVVALKGTPEWKVWLDSFSGHYIKAGAGGHDRAVAGPVRGAAQVPGATETVMSRS